MNGLGKVTGQAGGSGCRRDVLGAGRLRKALGGIQGLGALDGKLLGKRDRRRYCLLVAAYEGQ
jgi:hypothetical protein